MISRERIIAAAAEVYAQHGFRGATTRRIAESAGVNEITIFRQFGSKATLLHEALKHMSDDPHLLPLLPDVPLDPAGELLVWCEAHLAFLRSNRSLIRKAMSEIEERPEAGCSSVRPNRSAAAELSQYVRALHDGGYVADGHDGAPADAILEHAARAMLMASLFGDAMGRDVMPDMYPEPATGAAALYVRLFLRALGVHTSGSDRVAATSPTPPDRTRRRPAVAAPQHTITSKHRK